MKWTYIQNNLKVAKWNFGEYDIRTFSMRGHQTSASLLEIDPRNGKRLKHSFWFVFARKNQEFKMRAYKYLKKVIFNSQRVKLTFKDKHDTWYAEFNQEDYKNGTSWNQWGSDIQHCGSTLDIIEHFTNQWLESYGY